MSVRCVVCVGVCVLRPECLLCCLCPVCVWCRLCPLCLLCPVCRLCPVCLLRPVCLQHTLAEKEISSTLELTQIILSRSHITWGLRKKAD